MRQTHRERLAAGADAPKAWDERRGTAGGGDGERVRWGFGAAPARVRLFNHFLQLEWGGV